MKWIGYWGDADRCIGEMLDNSMTVAGEELVNSGVIFIAAAGNSNQKIVKNTNADYNNYWSNNADTPLSIAIHQAFGVDCYNTTSRRGFPQQIGRFTSGSEIVYPVLAIGALDAFLHSTGKEQKVDYSVMGESTDCYAPANRTLTSNNSYATTYRRADTYGSGYSTGMVSVCSAFAQIPGLTSFNSIPNTGYRITTSYDGVTVSGTCTTIPNSILGSSGLSGPFATPTGGDNNNGYWTVNLPFTMKYLDVNISTIFVGTNGYVQFQTSSGVEPSTTNNCYVNSPGPGIIFCGSKAYAGFDFSCQRIYYGVSGSAPTRTFRIRWEGTNATSGVEGSPNMVYEFTLNENSNVIDVQVGQNSAYGQPIFYDTSFSGTSAACPVAAGLIATQMQVNRSWTYANVRTWMQSLTLQSDTTFYQGPDPVGANSPDWQNVNSLMGGTSRVLYNNLVLPVTTGNTAGNFTLGPGLTWKNIP
jgi:hypothetical protein